jgi:hypothetical protein
MRLLVLLLMMGCAPESTEFVHVALSGTHADTSCSDCHGEVVEDREGWLCAECHEEDRPSDHDPAGCGVCHTLTDWGDAAVDHDRFFPLPHEGVDTCSECHTDSSDRSVFTCLDCHEHRQSEMDDEHEGEVSGYRYESNACLDCHPNGREEDGDDG